MVTRRPFIHAPAFALWAGLVMTAAAPLTLPGAPQEVRSSVQAVRAGRSVGVPPRRPVLGHSRDRALPTNPTGHAPERVQVVRRGAAPVPPRRGAVAARGSLTGRASWYHAQGNIAAAGPRLRDALGPDWRGQLVRVTAGGRSVVVRLVDWCQCLRGQRGERVIDLGSEAFAQLAPLPSGIVRVSLSVVAAPATDR